MKGKYTINKNIKK